MFINYVLSVARLPAVSVFWNVDGHVQLWSTCVDFSCSWRI